MVPLNRKTTLSPLGLTKTEMIGSSLSHRVGFLRRFGLKTGIHFAHFGLESGMVFEGTTESMNVFIVSTPNE